jgi:hypothetical protein
MIGHVHDNRTSMFPCCMKKSNTFSFCLEHVAVTTGTVRIGSTISHRPSEHTDVPISNTQACHSNQINSIQGVSLEVRVVVWRARKAKTTLLPRAASSWLVVSTPWKWLHSQLFTQGGRFDTCSMQSGKRQASKNCNSRWSQKKIEEAEWRADGIKNKLPLRTWLRHVTTHQSNHKHTIRREAWRSSHPLWSLCSPFM